MRSAAFQYQCTLAAQAQTQEELNRDGNGGSTDNVLTYGMGYHQQGVLFQPLGHLLPDRLFALTPGLGRIGAPHDGVWFSESGGADIRQPHIVSNFVLSA